MKELFTELGNLIKQYYNLIPQEYFCIIAIFCFAMCTIIIGNLLVELEYTKRAQLQRIPWNWATWEEILAPFIRIVHNGPPPI